MAKQGGKMSGGGKTVGAGAIKGSQKPIGKSGGTKRAVGGVSSSTAGKKW